MKKITTTPTGYGSPSTLVELEPHFQPPTSVVDKIYASLKHQILTCKLTPGQRLSEKELCSAFGVSRTPLREALNRLTMERLIELAHYRGYVVTAISLEDVVELCEIRAIVEGNAAALAAERATDEEVARLKELAEVPYEPGIRQTYESYLRANSSFHLALVRCTRNRRLENIVMTVMDQLQRPLYLGLDVGLNAAEATAEHLEVVEAIRRRDGPGVASIMGRHIGYAKNRILDVLNR
jgi:DNA-binding GntR family transcriptional regulator